MWKQNMCCFVDITITDVICKQTKRERELEREREREREEEEEYKINSHNKNFQKLVIDMQESPKTGYLSNIFFQTQVKLPKVS